MKKVVAKKPAEKPLEDYPLNGALCADCAEPQHETPSGVTCKNGHGGADSVFPSELSEGDIEDLRIEQDDDLETVTDFGFLVKEINNIDIIRTYEHLKKKIQLGPKRLDPDTLSIAVDEAPELAYKAAQLSILAKDRLGKFEEITFKIKYAEFAEEATKALEQDKKDGKISGQITKEKIENWIILKRPAYKKLLQEKSELEMAAEAFKSLAAQFESRKSLIQTQGRLAERKKNIVIGGNNE